MTGRVLPPIVNGERKAVLLGEIAEREDISLEQVVAVGDGANDIPMLKVGMGIAYRAKAAGAAERTAGDFSAGAGWAAVSDWGAGSGFA